MACFLVLLGKVGLKTAYVGVFQILLALTNYVSTHILAGKRPETFAMQISGVHLCRLLTDVSLVKGVVELRTGRRTRLRPVKLVGIPERELRVGGEWSSPVRRRYSPLS